ncbi:MAG: uracil-DNA glycosylase [Clostridiaceae bacterium]|nr:uracil-DNA glycosylase [Clostridiaceae bacterium]
MLENSWSRYLGQEFTKDYFINLKKWLDEEYRTKTIFPKREDIFNALKYTPYENVKCLILGQDPYATPGFSHGLAFSVKEGVKIPGSLKNIYKELNSDLGCYIPDNGYLKKWAIQGVLLLNAVLTVEEGKSDSHKGKGWELFTDKIIEVVDQKNTPVVFILWGNNARKKRELIKNPLHLIIESAHPSPLSASRGFFGTKPFSQANNFLLSHGIEPIDWQIENIEKAI